MPNSTPLWSLLGILGLASWATLGCAGPPDPVDALQDPLSHPWTLFTTQSPDELHQSDAPSPAGDYELGTRFESSVPGHLTAIRFWKDSFETGTHRGHIWDGAGRLLASVTFADETAAGWQQQALASPVPVLPNTEYLVSVNTGGTYYVTTEGGLASAIVHGGLSSIVGDNGRYGPIGAYPTQSWNDSNYFRDVVFMPSRASSTDAGVTATDAGAATRDAGTAPVDAGLTPDAGTDGGSVTQPGSDAGLLLNCAASPSRCGYPDETNTGVPSSVALVSSGYINVTQDDTVLDGLDISDGVQIQASNVTIKNCRITGGAESDFLIVIRPGSQNTVIEDSTIAGLDNGTNGVGMGIFDLSGDGTVLQRLNMYFCAECINGIPGTIRDNYIHDLAVWTGSQGVTHDEDIYFPCGSPSTVQHNTLFNPVDQTATLYTDSYMSVCENMLIDDNLLAGGGWTMYIPSTGANFSFTRNRFSRLFYPNGGGYGPIAWCPTADCAASATVTDNFWDDSGLPVQ